MEWRFITDPRIIQNRYKVSEDGVIRDVVRDRIVHQHKDSYGYMRTRLTMPSGKQIVQTIHRIVAKTFLEAPRPDQDQVDHIDGDRTNNHRNNLRWCTRLENWHNPITEKRHMAVNDSASLKRRVLCENTGEEFASMTDAARHFGMSLSAVTQSCEKYRQGKPRRDMKFGKPVMHFRLIEDDQPEEIKVDSLETQIRCASKSNAKAVRCIEDGNVYASVSAAARAYGLKPCTVSGSCKRMAAGGKKAAAFGTKICRHFEWVD